MKREILVKRTFGTPSKVIIGNVIQSLDEYLPHDKRVIIITDVNVHRRYAEIINRYDHIIIGVGESIKTLTTLQKVYADLLEMEADRKSFILGFGGGIVTDMSGFVASTYMRGVDFGFVATTLLSQVDASVGGKNGVNFDGYKNIIGTFNQPDFVLCDTSLLATLPEREFKSGLAEIIKSGLIGDPALFELFEQHSLAEFRENRQLLLEAIMRAVRVKADVVDQDERENGLRRTLNLGHTFAHAIEKTTRDFTHGEAVAIGLVMIAKLCVKMDMLSEIDYGRIRAVIEKMGLPSDSGVELKKLCKALKLDKKKDSDSVNFVMLRGVGECEIRRFTFDQIDLL